MQTNTNRIFLRGRMAARPALSHANHGVDYFTFPLAVRRLSGAEDRLNVVASQEQLAERAGISPGFLSQVEAPGMAVGLSLNTLFAISEVLDVPAYKLLQLDS